MSGEAHLGRRIEPWSGVKDRYTCLANAFLLATNSVKLAANEQNMEMKGHGEVQEGSCTGLGLSLAGRRTDQSQKK